VAEAQHALTATATDPTVTDPTTTDLTTDRPTTDQAVTATPSAGTPSAGETSVASAEDILADRAAIDLAEANLEIARARLTMVNLTSPIAGTVGAVSLAPGDTVTASSTTAVITVLGDAGHTVTATLSLAVIDVVEVGQTAQVTVASTDEVLTGRVSSIGVLNVSESSTPSYTVVITLDPTDARLFDGASAQAAIGVGGNEQTLTVPTSAVHVLAGATTVTVLRDGEPVEVEVTTGAVGSELTEVLSGLEAGEVVVLADLTQSLTGDDAETDSGLTGLGGSGTTEVVIRGELPSDAVAPSFTRSGD
jgi:HlyD family secretion protein